MALWQRRARAVIGLSGLTFGLIVFLTIRDRDERPTASGVERLDPEAVAESTGAVVTQTRGGRSEFTIEAERQLTYADGRTRLEDVTVRVLERAGRDFLVTGREAAVGQDGTTVTMTGDVHVVASDGLTVRTGQASYDDGAGVLRAAGPVHFERAGLAGSGVGASYDRAQDRLHLLEQAHLTFGGADAVTSIRSGSAVLARGEGHARFDGDVRVERAGWTMEADSAVAHLTGEDRLRLVELRGRARVAGAGTGPGTLQTMQSESMDLAYSEDGEAVERATLGGGASLAFAGEAGRRITANWMDVTLAPGGGPVTGLAARDRVVLDLPGEPGVPARHIRAARLDASGDRDRGLTRARLEERVEYRETAPRSAERTIRAATLDLSVAAGFGAIGEARFAGAAVFTEGDLSAAAPVIQYDAAEGVARLSGPPGVGGEGPRLSDERLTVHAGRMTLRLEDRHLDAEGDVRSVYRASGEAGGQGGSTRLPALLDGAQPVNVTSERVAYEGATSMATYTGGARLWQGDTAVQGEVLVLDGDGGNLTATERVRSTMILEQIDERTGAVERVSTVATAGELRYEDAARSATYSTEARVHGPQGDLRAARIELVLEETGRRLARAEAYRNVRLESEGRTALGDRLTYHAGEGRYVMRGTPVSIVEECRETTGQTLTFYRSTDTITVDGNEEIRTQTKSGGRCP